MRNLIRNLIKGLKIMADIYDLVAALQISVDALTVKVDALAAPAPATIDLSPVLAAITGTARGLMNRDCHPGCSVITCLTAPLAPRDQAFSRRDGDAAGLAEFCVRHPRDVVAFITNRVHGRGAYRPVRGSGNRPATHGPVGTELAARRGAWSQQHCGELAWGDIGTAFAFFRLYPASSAYRILPTILPIRATRMIGASPNSLKTLASRRGFEPLLPP